MMALKKTVAEGVEDEERLNILRAMRYDLIKGWLFAKAASADEVAEFIIRNRESVIPASVISTSQPTT